MRLPRFAVISGALLIPLAAPTPSFAQGNEPAQAGPIDACGTLVQGAECVLFEGDGGRFVLSDYGRFKVGDAVRVVGTVNPNCVTICGEGDGCIQDALVYAPEQFPCGTSLPSFPGDLCTGAAGALTSGLALGMWFARRKA